MCMDVVVLECQRWTSSTWWFLHWPLSRSCCHGSLHNLYCWHRWVTQALDRSNVIRASSETYSSGWNVSTSKHSIYCQLHEYFSVSVDASPFYLVIAVFLIPAFCVSLFFLKWSGRSLILRILTSCSVTEYFQLCISGPAMLHCCCCSSSCVRRGINFFLLTVVCLPLFRNSLPCLSFQTLSLFGCYNLRLISSQRMKFFLISLSVRSLHGNHAWLRQSSVCLQRQCIWLIWVVAHLLIVIMLCHAPLWNLKWMSTGIGVDFVLGT